jgi:pimeloyl-ACP methyl ester carboxylesterase
VGAAAPYPGNAALPEIDVARPEPPPFRDEVILVEGCTVHARVADVPAGAPPRPPLVLVHGLGLSGRYMMPTARRLACRYAVHVPDLPGFGDSGKPARTLDVPGLAAALAAWMAAKGMEPAVLLGNSFGCQVIVELAARYPERVAGTVLQGPTTPPDERSWLMQFIRWRQNAPHDPPDLSPLSKQDYRKAGYFRTLVTFHYSLVHRPEDKLAAIEAPSLVVRGQEDPICREDWAERVAAGLPEGRLVLIPGVAHTLVYTAPDQLAAVTASFIEAG